MSVGPKSCDEINKNVCDRNSQTHTYAHIHIYTRRCKSILVYAHRCSTHLNGIFYASGDAHWIYHGATAVFTASCYCFCIYWLLTLLYFSVIHIYSKRLVWVDVLVYCWWWYVVFGRGWNLRRWTRIAGSREFKDLFEMRIWFYQYFIFIYIRI